MIIRSIRVEAFAARRLGFDFSVGPAQSFRTWFAIWWARGCDFGVAFGRREFRHMFKRARNDEPRLTLGDADPYAEFRMDAADNGDA